MLQSEIVNSLFESFSLDDRQFEKKTWAEVSATNFIQDQYAQPSKLMFSTHNLKDLFILPREGYVQIALEFRRNDEQAFKPTDKYAMRNHILSLFDTVEVQVSDHDHKIEELRYNEHWANIIHLIKWSDDYARSLGEESLFSRDRPVQLQHTLNADVTADSFDPTKASCNEGLVIRSLYVKSHQMIGTLYLRDLPFFQSYYGIWTKSRFRIILTPNYSKPIVAAITKDADKADGMHYKIVSAYLYIPEVTLMPETKVRVLKAFNDGLVKTFKWQSIDCYQSPQFALNATSVQWTISSEIKKPSWVYIVLTQDFTEDEYQKKLTQIYYQWNIFSYSLMINNKETFAESNVNFNKLNAHRLYNYIKQNMNHYNDRESLNSGSQLSYLDFCKNYRILAFNLEDIDCNAIYNSRGDQSVSVTFKATVSPVDKPLVMYCFIMREKEIGFNFKNDRLEISLNSL
jgi:hypothetical protein